MKNITHYFQTSPNSTFRPSISPPKEVKNTPNETSSTALSKSGVASESESSSPTLKTYKRHESRSNSSCEIIDSEETKSPSMVRNAGSCSQKSKKKPDNKINVSVVGIEAGISEAKMKDSKRHSKGSDQAVDVVESDDETLQSEEVVSPNAFQILMSTQQVFSSSNSGKKECFEEADDASSKKERKRIMKENLEQMSKRKLNMETSMKANGVDKPARKRRRIVKESDLEDNDDDPMETPVLNKSSDNNLNENIRRKKMPELDIVFKKEQNRSKTPCGKGKGSVGDKKKHEDLIKSNKSSDSAVTESGTITLSKLAKKETSVKLNVNSNTNTENVQDLSEDENIITFSPPLNKTKGGKILNTPFNKVKGKQNKVSTELKECKSEDVRNPQILKENGKAWKIGPLNNTDIENNQLDLTLAVEESEVSVDEYKKNDEKAIEAITENKTVKRKCTAKLKEKLSTKKRKVKGGEFFEKNDSDNSNPEEKAVVVNNANALVSEDCYENNEIEILIDSENSSIVSKAEIAASDTQTPSTSDKRKSNILNYFNKVSSEDRNRHSDKFEVKVDVHFPVVGKPSQREVGKSAKKTINGNKTKKKGKNEIEDDIQLVDSELIDKPLGNSVNSSKLSSDNSLTSVSVENADSDLKENMSSTPTISSEKSFLSSGWRMKICMSDVSGSASKKHLKKNNSISKCKKLKLCNGNVGGKEKEVTCFDSDDICGESKSETTTSLNDSQNITSEREVTKSESSSVNDDVCNISINIEDSKTLESNAKIVSASNKISQSSKQKKLTTKENEQIGGTSGLKQKLIFAVKPKTDEEENDYCEDTPVVIDKGEENRSSKQKGILMFTRKLGAKEVVENNSGGISFVNNLKKQGINKTSPSNRTSGLKKSMSSKKTLANNKKSGKDVTDSSSVKKSTPKKAIVVEEEVTPSRKLTRSKQNSRTPKNKPAFSENSTFSDQNKNCGDGVGSQNVTPSKTSANISQGDSSPKSMSAKKVFNKKVNQCSRVKNLLSEKNVSPRGARMSADVAEQEKPEVVETPIRSRRSCTLTPSAGSQYVEISDSEDSAKEEKATKVIKKRTTPLKNRNAKMFKESPAQSKKMPPSNLNTKRLRLKLRRFSSVTGSESSDSWRSVSPESVVNLTDNDEEEEEEDDDDDDEPIILKKKSKKSEDKISDDDILKLIAERKVVMQAIKRTRGKLTKLFSAEEKSCTQTLSADKSEKQGSQKPANIRLAPVFMKQNSKRLDKASLQAKKIFLQSGVPEVVKKMVEVQKLAEELAEEHMLFPAISHVQQREENGRMWKLEKMLHKFPQRIGDEDVIKTCNIPVGVFTSCKELENKDKKMLNPSRPNKINVFRDFLRSIKAESPDFPVYRSFRYLYVQNRPLPNESSMAKKKRRSRGNLKKGQPEDKKVEISQASWSSKYRPVTSENIIGNRQSIKKLKHWLELWVQVMEGKVFQKSAKSDANSDDDFINDGSDDEKKSSLLKNTVVITGPNGCGKTMAVFTLARELGYKVLEVNAASKRTGRRILSELLEATQSHQVHSKGDESNSGIKNFFAAKHKPVVKKPKEKEKELQGNKLSLILVEDVDVVFEEQDEGFVSALSTLMSVSKRPIVLVSSNPSCAHLGRLMEKSLALEFKTVSSKLLGAWLQIICLLEGVRVKRLTMEELLFQNGGDVRKTLMQLQFWVLSGGNVCNEILDSRCKSENAIDLEDDSSNSSWVSMVDDKKANEGNHPFHSGCVERLLEQESGVIPVSRSKLWWNIPRVLRWSSSTRITTFNLCGTKTNKLVETTDFELTDIKSIDEVDNKSVTSESEIESVSNTKTDSADVLPGKDLKPEKNFVKNWKSVCSIEDVNALSRLTEVLSIVESFRIGSVGNFFEPERCLWEQDVKDSLSLSEDMRPVWCGAETVNSSISSWLVRESVVQCAKVLQPNQNCSVLSDLQRNISEDELRWRENQHSASLELSEAVPMLYWPERRTLSIDYLSSLRNISRLEQDRSYINGKRNNRFFHYLKGLGVDPVSSVLDAACSAFQSNSKS